MVKLEISFNDGLVLNEMVESFDAVEMENKMNNREQMSMAIGNSVYTKHSIRFIRVVETVVE